jgi:hypothetical protein
MTDVALLREMVPVGWESFYGDNARRAGRNRMRQR